MGENVYFPLDSKQEGFRGCVKTKAHPLLFLI